jgi:hypothetical protein
MFMPFFVLATWPFWALVALTIGLVMWGLEHESPLSSTFVVMLFAATLVCFSDLHLESVWMWVTSHRLLLTEYVVGYIAAGGVYAFVKWYFFTLNKADQIEENIDSYRNNYAKGYYNGKFDTLADYLQSLAPAPMENKGRIYLWMAYWPCSALWTLINDPLKRIYRFFLDMMSATMTKISKQVFSRRFGNIK